MFVIQPQKPPHFLDAGLYIYINTGGDDDWIKRKQKQSGHCCGFFCLSGHTDGLHLVPAWSYNSCGGRRSQIYIYGKYAVKIVLHNLRKTVQTFPRRSRIAQLIPERVEAQNINRNTGQPSAWNNGQPQYWWSICRSIHPAWSKCLLELNPCIMLWLNRAAVKKYIRK